jgi:hypothetical protein
MKTLIHSQSVSMLEGLKSGIEFCRPDCTFTAGQDSRGNWLLIEDTLDGKDAHYTLTENGLQPGPELKDYSVTLVEVGDEGDLDFEFQFECQAEDEEHAKEQASNAYPECAVLKVNHSEPRPKQPETWFAFADNQLVPLGRHQNFEQADAVAPGQTHWIFNDQSLKQFIEQAVPMLQAPVITSVPVQHWSVAEGSSEEGVQLPTFSLKVTDKRALNSSFDVEVIPNEADDISQMSAWFEINNLIEDKEHLPCAHFHFNSTNLAFSLFKRGDHYIVRLENQVQVKPTTLPDGTQAFVISE